MALQVTYVNHFDDIKFYHHLFKTENILDEPTLIICQNKQTATLLEQQLAEHNSIASGLNLKLIEQACLELFHFIPELEKILAIENGVIKRPPLRENEAKLVIFKYLEQEFNPNKTTVFTKNITDYIGSDYTKKESKLYELASYFAPLILGYALNNSSLIQSFENSDLFDGDGHELFLSQKNLWINLFSLKNETNYPIFGGLLYYISNKELALSKINFKIIVVGSCFLKEAELNFLNHLSKYCSVNYLAISPLQLDIYNQDNDFINLYSSSYLAYFNMLKNIADIKINYHSHSQSTSTSQLSLLQQKIALPDNKDIPIINDGSITILQSSAFSREIEIVKEEILSLLKLDTNLYCHEIAIVSCDIKNYIPYIEAIFSHNNDDYDIPFTILDNPKADDVSEVILAILNLHQSRFSRKDIFNLFSMVAFANANQITDDDLDLLKTFCQQYNAIFSFNEEHKETMHIGHSPIYSWQHAFNSFCSNVLYQNYTEQDFSSANVSRLSTMIELIDSLYNDVKSLDKNIFSFKEHYRHIEALVRKYLYHYDYMDTISNIFKNIQENLNTIQSFEKFSNKNFSYDTVKKYIEKLPSLQEHRSGSAFIKQGVACASLKAIRSLPFKVIFFIGLGDSNFPLGTTNSPSFDLNNNINFKSKLIHYAKEESLQHFIEIIMASREKLYLMFQAKSEVSGEKLEPSFVLEDLLLFANKEMPLNSNHPWVKEIAPLQSFLTATSPQPTFFKQNLKLAKIYFNEHENINIVEYNLLQEKNKVIESKETEDIVYANFLAFFKSPMSYYLEKSLAIRQSTYELSHEIESEELFIDSLTSWQIKQEILTNCLKERKIHDNIDNTLQKYLEKGQLSQSIIGKNQLKKITEECFNYFFSFNDKTELSNQSKLYDFHLINDANEVNLSSLYLDTININKIDYAITGELAKLIIDNNRIIFCTQGSRSFPSITEAYLLYLVISSTFKDSSFTFDFNFFSKDYYNKLSLPLLDKEEARSRIKLLIELYLNYKTKLTILHKKILKDFKSIEEDSSFYANYLSILESALKNTRNTSLDGISIKVLNDEIENIAHQDICDKFYKTIYCHVLKWQSEIIPLKK